MEWKEPQANEVERVRWIPVGGGKIEGNLVVPEGARSIVLFAHGTGSSRHSPRNRFVARMLKQGRHGTLLMDLLTPQEEAQDIRTGRIRFDIERLSQRLVDATNWLKQDPVTGGLRIGYFGASTGAGAALVAAAERPEDVGAVVSRGGRPDLAGSALSRVRCPTLLIVGGSDAPVIELNRHAMDQLQAETRLDIVPGATHLFEEPGALEDVARRASSWFECYLSPAAAARAA